MAKYKYLSLEDRRQIETMYCEGSDAKQISAQVGASPSTIYRELQRGSTGKTDHNLRPGYSAEVAEKRLRANFRRRGKKQTNGT